MKWVKNEDIWDEIGVADLILVSGCAAYDKSGGISMDCGAAKEMADRFPLARKVFGDVLQHRKKRLKEYGILLSSESLNKQFPVENTHMGLFQVSLRPNDTASPEIIKNSVRMLSFWADKWPRIAMTMPGVGNGKLKHEDVFPLMQKLPDNVWVYERGVVIPECFGPSILKEAYKDWESPTQSNPIARMRPLSDNDFHRR